MRAAPINNLNAQGTTQQFYSSDVQCCSVYRCVGKLVDALDTPLTDLANGWRRARLVPIDCQDARAAILQAVEQVMVGDGETRG